MKGPPLQAALHLFSCRLSARYGWRANPRPWTSTIGSTRLDAGPDGIPRIRGSPNSQSRVRSRRVGSWIVGVHRHYINQRKKTPRPLIWVCHRDSAAGEPIGTGRPYLRRTLVREHLSSTPQRTTSESAGVTGTPRKCFAIRIGDRHSAAGEPIGTARTHPCSVTIRKCVGLTLQGSQIEFAGVAHRLRGLRRLWVGNSDTAAGKAVGTGRAHRRGATIRKRVGLTLQGSSPESAGMTHLVSCKTSAEQKRAESQVLH
jgi:hypothetical protein